MTEFETGTRKCADNLDVGFGALRVLGLNPPPTFLHSASSEYPRGAQAWSNTQDTAGTGDTELLLSRVILLAV